LTAYWIIIGTEREKTGRRQSINAVSIEREDRKKKPAVITIVTVILMRQIRAVRILHVEIRTTITLEIMKALREIVTPSCAVFFRSSRLFLYPSKMIF
jgi:hypothetical protein